MQNLNKIEQPRRNIDFLIVILILLLIAFGYLSLRSMGILP